MFPFYLQGYYDMKDIMNTDKKSANEQPAKRIGANYQPHWIKQ